MEENRKMRKKDDVSEMKNYVFVSFFEKNVRRITVKHNLFIQHLAKKMASRNLFFCFEKSTKMRIPRRGFNNRERKQRVSFFLQQKEDFVFPFSKGVSTL